eukprot:CAMPEP_0206377264 /NCGR_PEP_ID=MMETSP0294-20121207/10049_1 /ASSEMBLY_ACC=CAM_ASM_000327 /TAXON_ID=39354 /ORGANISM="Heterosigma akashiwo, Strain CCMP2393" /LENGTH=320 /DNA_ID=CAMNT_0053825697 /DNA_START=242 /DNA_END=1201 /DNA_ORIENTATION=+
MSNTIFPGLLVLKIIARANHAAWMLAFEGCYVHHPFHLVKPAKPPLLLALVIVARKALAAALAQHLLTLALDHPIQLVRGAEPAAPLASVVPRGYFLAPHVLALFESNASHSVQFVCPTEPYFHSLKTLGGLFFTFRVLTGWPTSIESQQVRRKYHTRQLVLVAARVGLAGVPVAAAPLAAAAGHLAQLEPLDDDHAGPLVMRAGQRGLHAGVVVARLDVAPRVVAPLGHHVHHPVQPVLGAVLAAPAALVVEARGGGAPAVEAERAFLPVRVGADEADHPFRLVLEAEPPLPLALEIVVRQRLAPVFFASSCLQRDHTW